MTNSLPLTLLFTGLLCTALPTPGVAQAPAGALPAPAVAVSAAAPLALPAGFDGAAPPDLPHTVSRNTEGQVTVRVIHLTAPLRLDGALDEEVYTAFEPISDFVQAEPLAGTPATEKTEVWLSYDDQNVYVSVRLSESEPGRMVVNEMRRDSFSVVQNENFQFVFDTFHDRRNAVSFQFNPLGGRMDGQVTNESQFNSDWNPIWRLQVRRTADGWTAEAAVPFKSLRYNPGQAQLWGFQARRINRWKNEVSYLTRLPNNIGINGHTRVSLFAEMVGLEIPSGTRALDLKPYLTSNVTTDRSQSPTAGSAFGRDFGFDAKYGITQNMAADFTYNTDFAQVEADEQQVNLTRFSLFFPEKRDFFLENQGLFQFATGNGANNNANSETPILFYSRSIGLDAGQAVPLNAGGRLSGRMGAFNVAMLNLQTGELGATPSTNFSVARVRRDILRRSAVGAIYTRRSVATRGGGDAETFGVDGAFSFFENLSINTYWATTRTPDTVGENQSYRGQLFYNADRYGVQLERLAVDDNFDPQVGFMRRQDFKKSRAMFRFSPRPRQRFRSVRKFTYQTSVEYFDDNQGQFQSRERRLEFATEFQRSDRLDVQFEDLTERLVQPFRIARGVTIPVGDYALRTFIAQYTFGQQRKVAGQWGLDIGPFYDGQRTTLRYSSGRINVNPRVGIEPSLSINRVTLPYGDFTAKLFGTRTTFTITPLAFVSGLVQYNSSNNSVNANVRFRWEYQPGSELFVVYNEGRDTSGLAASTLQNRAVIIKINRLFRY